MAPQTELIDETGRVVFRGTQSPGGGSQPQPYAAVQGSGLTNVAKGAPIPFGTVVVDADGFWDAINSQFTIPAGKGGLYHVDLYVNTAGSDGDPGPVVAPGIATSGAFPNIETVIGSTGGSDTYEGSLGGVMVLADGDSITASIFYSGSATDLLVGLGFLSLQRIGDA